MPPFNDRPDAAPGQGSTDTRAYNANEVAQVFMSFDRNDLEGDLKTLTNGSETLEPGFYARTDALGVRSSLERFEVDFAYGSNTSMYKIRLLNPTTELEYYFAQFFSHAYPASHGIISGWVTEEKRKEHLKSVTGDTDEYYMDTGPGSRNVVPTVYIRWGYGTGEENGLSQIHKCRVSDVRYQMNANEDKVVELMLVDLFSFTRTSNIYNKREHIAMTPWKDESNPNGKTPSQMIMEVLGYFATVYPELFIISDLSKASTSDMSFADKLDSHVELLGLSLAKTAQQKAENQFNQGRQGLLAEGETTRVKVGEEPSLPDDKYRTSIYEDSRETWQEVQERLESAEEGSEDAQKREKLEEQLNAPIATMTEWDKLRQKKGEVGEAFKLQALKIFFEQIGLHWEVNTDDKVKVFTNGKQSTDQIDSGFVSHQDAIDHAHTEADKSLKIFLPDYVKEKPPSLFNSSNVSDSANRLSFWPPILDFSEAPEIAGAPIAGIANIGIHADGTAINEYDFGTAYGSNGASPLEDKIIVKFNEVMLDEVIQYEGNDTNGDSTFSEVPRVKFFGINGPSELNSETASGEGGTGYYLFNPNTLPPGVTLSGNPNNTAFLLREYPTSYAAALESILTVSSAGFEGMAPFTSSPSAAAYPMTTIQKAPPEDSPRELRFMTEEEKTTAKGLGVAPLWLTPGPVNSVRNWGMERPANQLHYFQEWTDGYTFSYSDLLRMFPQSIYLEAAANPLATTFPALLCEVRTPYQFSMGNYDEEGLSETFVPPFYAPANVANENEAYCLGKDRIRKLLPVPADMSFHPTKYPVLNKQDWTLLDFSQSGLMTGTGVENEFTSWRETYCPWWEKHVTHNGTAVYPERWDYGLESGVETARPGSLDNWERIVNQQLYLEPTAETWKYLSDIPVSMYEEITEKDQANPILELESQWMHTAPPEQVPKEVKLPAVAKLNGYLSLGTDGDAPNISTSLEKVVNALNSWLADSSSKIQIIVLDLSRLTKTQQREFLEDDTRLPDFNKEEKQKLLDENKTLLFVASDDTINNWTSRLINPVYSFPEVNTGNAGQEGIIFLDYATKDSIITDLKFEGEYRWLLGVSQAVFMNRYFGSLNEYFDSQTAQGRLINRFLGPALLAKINQLRENPEGTTFEGYTLGELQSLKERYDRRPGQIESETFIDSDVLALLPGLVSYYSFGNLTKLVGEQSAKDLTILSCLVNDPFTLELLFPEMEFQAGTNAKDGVLAVGASRQNWTGTILTRRVDFATTYMRVGEDNQREIQRKMLDTNFFFTEAMRQTFWEVELETLGIPELDNPVVEFTQRDIILRVYDARLSSASPHWLSGAYRIRGISHNISPTEGYKTKLKLYRSDIGRPTNLLGGLEVPSA